MNSAGFTQGRVDVAPSLRVEHPGHYKTAIHLDFSLSFLQKCRDAGWEGVPRDPEWMKGKSVTSMMWETPGNCFPIWSELGTNMRSHTVDATLPPPSVCSCRRQPLVLKMVGHSTHRFYVLCMIDRKEYKITDNYLNFKFFCIAGPWYAIALKLMEFGTQCILMWKFGHLVLPFPAKIICVFLRGCHASWNQLMKNTRVSQCLAWYWKADFQHQDNWARNMESEEEALTFELTALLPAFWTRVLYLYFPTRLYNLGSWMWQQG